MKALRWLLRQPAVTAAMINQCSQQLLAIPGVPLAAAEALVRAGLRLQITAQQLVARAHEGFYGFAVWVEAFTAAAVPLEEWAADLPAELRHVCCCDRVTETNSEQLTPARTADLLAVAFNVAAYRRRHRDPLTPANYQTVLNITDVLCQSTYAYAATAQLPAAAVEALLRLAVQLHGRTTNLVMADAWPQIMQQLCSLPAAAQIATAAVVELVQQAMQTQGLLSVAFVTPVFELLAGRQLAAEHTERLLLTLRGPSAAAAAAANLRWVRMPGGRTAMAWLASQPGAAAATAAAAAHLS
uniref:Uncharacterized protein n=1 Tax=Tetradesmus obliquus TaxID=3088 RepID=A0A383VTJ7_TETOB|eukprot:jgi/Sobl393_1/13238/SZX68815.1